MQKSTVLVVDDDEDTLDSVRDVLIGAGFEVDTAATGRDALGKLLDEQQPAVIVLDIRMPVMDGRQFLTIVRAYHRLASIPVIVLSAVDLAPQLTESVEVVMRKPFRTGDLVANVQALARRGAPGEQA
ncbi:MAG TPA: response regulator [Polyangia bacterium]|jgi:DNA-binding response OmpR family regulator|nr:response regulator [Polyangia bacterium]